MTRILIIPQNAFLKSCKNLYTTTNRGKFYVGIAKKYENSTILYTVKEGTDVEATFQMDNKGVNLKRLKGGVSHKSKFKYIDYLISIFKLIRAIITHDLAVVVIPNKTAVLATVLAKFLGKISILYVAGDWQEIINIPYMQRKAPESNLKKLKIIISIIFENIAVRFANSVYVAGNKLLRKYPKKGQIKLVKPMIQFTLNDVIIRQTRNHKLNNILYVGYLTPLKGIQDTLDSFKLIHYKYPDTFLHIVGDGELFKDIQNLGNASIKLYGYIAEKNTLSEIYKNCDLFMFASHSEGFPRVLYEAMIHNLPIITTGVGGISDYYKSGENAIIVPVGEPYELYRAYCSLREDSMLAIKLAKNSMIKICNELIDNPIEQFVQEINLLTTKTRV